MAGTYIPIQDDIARCKEVVHMASITGFSRHEIVGLCVELWGWASNITEDGSLVDVTVDGLVDTLVTRPERGEAFISAMFKVKWLVMIDGVITIPEWDKWFSRKAKARMDSSLRQKRWREKKTRPSTSASTRPSTSASPNALLQEQEQETTNVVSKKQAKRNSDYEIPASLDSEKFRAAWAEWLASRRERRLTVAPRTLAKQLANLASWGEAKAIESIEKSITAGWQGLFEPTANRKTNTRPIGPGQRHEDDAKEEIGVF